MVRLLWPHADSSTLKYLISQDDCFVGERDGKYRADGVRCGVKSAVRLSSSHGQEVG